MSVFRLSFISCVLIFLLSYFLYHTIYGGRGLIAQSNSKTIVKKFSENLDEIRIKRVELEHKVKLLGHDSLDKDMLEEEARKVLGIAKSAEKVVIKDDNNQK